MQQHGGDLVVDCFEPQTHTRRLSEAAGSILSAHWSRDAFTASRGVLGGGGEGTDREFRLAVDTTRESLWGMLRESFFDARDVGSDYESAIKDVPEKLTDLREANNEEDKAAKVLKLATKTYNMASASLEDAQDASNAAAITRWTALKADALADKNDATTEHNAKVTAQTAARTAYDVAVDLRNRLRTEFNADMTARGEQKLAEGASKYGLDVSLAETDTVGFGRPVDLGSSWPVEINGVVVSTETVKEVELSDTVADGLKVTPSLGEGSSRPLRKLMQVVGNVVRKVSDRDAGR